MNINSHLVLRGGVARGLASAVVCAALGVACSRDEPCFSGSLGRQHRVTVVERWDESSRFSGGQYSPFPCPATFDLMPGSSFVVDVDHFNMEATSCSCGSGNVVEGPEGWSWTAGDEVGPCKGSFFQGGGLGARDACHGRVRIDIEAKQIPTGSSVQGQAPLAWAQRDFIVADVDGGIATCPVDGQSCSDRFVVEISEPTAR